MKRKGLKAYVRLDKVGQPVAGSMIYRDKKPYGKFVPLVNPSSDVCCPDAGPTCGPNFIRYNTSEVTPGQAAAAYSVTDSSCNNYLLYFYQPPVGGPYPPETLVNYSLLKQDSEGNVLWFKQLNFEQPPDTDGSLFYLLLDETNNRVYACGSSGNIIAMDLDGTAIWAKSFNTSISPGAGFYVGAYAISPDGAFIYTSGYFSFSNGFIFKIDAATGNILKAVRPYVNLGNPFSSYGVVVDQQGNVFAPMFNSTVSSPRYLELLKFDADLNLIWTTSLTPLGTTFFAGWDTPAIDFQGNIYIEVQTFDSPNPLDNKQGIVKIDGNTGAILWRGVVSVVSSGNGYYVGDYRFDASNTLYATAWDASGYQVFKITSAGSYQFCYTINIGETPSNYWYNSGRFGGNVVNNTLLLPSFTVNGPYKSYNFKLPTTAVEGTYGPFTFVNTTADYSFQKYVPVCENPHTWTIQNITAFAQPKYVPIAATTLDSTPIFLIQTL